MNRLKTVENKNNKLMPLFKETNSLALIIGEEARVADPFLLKPEEMFYKHHLKSIVFQSNYSVITAVEYLWLDRRFVLTEQF